MRLINTKTLLLEEFFGTNIPRYAILSHTWGEEEVTYQEWVSGDPRMREKKGFNKVARACEQALKEVWPLEWLWADTCCIDKASSADLSEAINSMFAWYRDSEICYVHLEDVPSIEKIRHSGEADGPKWDLFRNSRWFTRGWTLQELIAPQKIVFYSADWTFIGVRDDPILPIISGITGISKRYLRGSKEWNSMPSVAQRMSWLATRVTTRVEDIAYCVLGIFDINMPLLYGEGMKAFTRLQEEIAKQTNDHTLFCWSWEKTLKDRRVGLFAPSPDAFRYSGDFVSARDDGPGQPYSVTNMGLSIRLPVLYSPLCTIIVLNASSRKGSNEERVCIPLVRLDDHDLYARSNLPRFPFMIGKEQNEATTRSLIIQSRSIEETTMFMNSTSNLRLPDSPIFQGLFTMPSALSRQALRALYGIMLFVDKDVCANELPSGALRISTHPAKSWLGAWNTLRLLPIERSGTTALHGALLSIVINEDQPEEECCRLFFAASPNSQGGTMWHCEIASDAAVKQAEDLEELFDIMTSEWLKSRNLTRRDSSHSRHSLSIGAPVNLGQTFPDLMVRSAVLTCKEDTQSSGILGSKRRKPMRRTTTGSSRGSSKSLSSLFCM